MRALIVVALIGCSSSERAAPKPRLDAAVEVVVAPPPDATPLKIIQEGDGFDFRQVPLEPEKFVGTEQRCLVAGTEPHDDATVRVRCDADHGQAFVVMSREVVPEREHLVLVRIDAAGEPPISARATFRGVEGKLREPEPPSRCCRHDDAPDEPPPPAAYDFDELRRDNDAWKTPKICQVRFVGNVERSTRFPPDVARFEVEVSCAKPDGDTVRIALGSGSSLALLRIENYQYLRVQPWWLGRQTPPTALLRGVARDVTSRH